MATKMQSKSTVVALAEQLIAGTNKHLTDVTHVMLAGGSFTPAQVTTQLQALVTLRDDVDAAKASTKAKLARETTDMPALRSFMAAFVTFVKAAYKGSPDVLADFGLNPKTRAPMTVEAKAVAAAKRKATRAARHTMGATQKKAVKGAVTGIVVTPITTATSNAAPSAPAPVATAPASPSTPATSPGATASPAPRTA